MRVVPENRCLVCRTLPCRGSTSCRHRCRVARWLAARPTPAAAVRVVAVGSLGSGSSASWTQLRKGPGAAQHTLSRYARMSARNG